MSTMEPAEILRTMAETLGVGPAELARLAETLGAGDVPTVAEFAPTALEACSDVSRPTYATHIRTLVATFGDRRLTDVTTADLIGLRDQTVRRVAEAKVARAVESGRQLRSYETDGHGRGAGENAVRAWRFFFRTAEDAELIVTNPAAKVKPPKRLPAPERPLLPDELAEVATIWCTTGNDCELDTLMFEFHRKTAARREGGLNLRLGDLDERRGAITLTEKFGKTRDMPYDVDGLVRLRRFAVSRGATRPSDHVFRTVRHTKISRRRYGTIYDRIDERTTWTERLDLGVHWIRHTTLDDVRTVAGIRVASAYAGHEDSSQGTIGLYSKVTFEELARAFEALFGPRFAEDTSVQ